MILDKNIFSIKLLNNKKIKYYINYILKIEIKNIYLFFKYFRKNFNNKIDILFNLF